MLFRLRELAERRELQIAESLLDKAIDAGYRKPESYLERARARAKAGDEVRASDDALAVLDFDAVPGHVVKQAIRLFGGQAPVDIHEAPAIISLDPTTRSIWQRAWRVWVKARSATLSCAV